MCVQKPFVQEYNEITGSQGGWDAIRSMQVRGAPAIAIAAALSLAVEVHKLLASSPFPFSDGSSASAYLIDKLEFLKTSRPTAVNLFEAADRLSKVVKEKSEQTKEGEEAAREVLKTYIAEAERFAGDAITKYHFDSKCNARGSNSISSFPLFQTSVNSMHADDIAANKLMGKHGAEHILKIYENKPVRVITHCNTGSLATAGEFFHTIRSQFFITVDTFLVFRQGTVRRWV